MISKKQFDSYENVRLSGRTNMVDTRNVMALSGLSKDVILEIMENYNELLLKFTTEVLK